MTTTTGAFDLQKTQKIRKVVLGLCLLAVVALALFTSTPGGDSAVHEGIEALGLTAMVVALIGRAWCSLYIGGRKKAEIVSTGPYSISRNPLYLFSYVAAFGVGAQTGSILLAAGFVLIAMVVFHLTILREEAWLLAQFGETYAAYMRRTPRLGPDLSKWRDEPELQVRPRFFLTTLRDGLVLFLAIPVFEGIEMLQTAGFLPILLHLR